MVLRLVIAIAAAASLAGCGRQSASNEETPRTANSARAPSNTAAPPDDRAALARELTATADALRGSLPLRQPVPQGEVTITAVEARGTELVHCMELPNDLSAAGFEQYRAQLPARLCSDPSILQTLLRGASYTYVVRDKGGEEFTATVESC